ncbi:unnamed protein product [Rangifer tarandus platyrhynchus]|uniref:Uncharacterized protein n=1 Tax=Rangifer tarandus platyrhynchus TaxID=3082113 RepID=A0ABN8XY75_RANTA|nr:unnamed protein product [Rangifer tarandus platyrhynchus]
MPQWAERSLAPGSVCCGQTQIACMLSAGEEPVWSTEQEAESDVGGERHPQTRSVSAENLATSQALRRHCSAGGREAAWLVSGQSENVSSVDTEGSHRGTWSADEEEVKTGLCGGMDGAAGSWGSDFSLLSGSVGTRGTPPPGVKPPLRGAGPSGGRTQAPGPHRLPATGHSSLTSEHQPQDSAFCPEKGDAARQKGNRD